ncbi:MAG TPA: GNAT family N-acetyltransferase [Sporichthyaceae bacterium]|nr:GNAT family N-acetyltransferase [Sporichthyaceae bacterium]
MPGATSAPAELLAFRELTGRPSDRLLVERFARNCGAEALRARFFLPPGTDPQGLHERHLRYLTAGPPEGVGLVALVGGTPVGVLNLVATGPEQAELAVVVAQRWQRLGIARRLVDDVRRRGRWTGWTLNVLLQWENIAGRGFVQSLPGPRRTLSVEYGCIEQEIHPFEFAPTAELSPTETGPRRSVPAPAQVRGRLVQPARREQTRAYGQATDGRSLA